METINLRDSEFAKILMRNNKQIRDDRALRIIEDAELEYKRKIENLERDIKVLRRERDLLLDLSPGNSYQLTPEKFDPLMFVKKDLEMGQDIRNLEITLEIARAKYTELFVPKAKPEVTSGPTEN